MTQAQDPERRIERVIITPIDRVAVPAPEAGVLQEVLVTEGANVERGQRLAQLDAGEATLALQHAEAAYATQKHIASDEAAVDVAAKRLDLGQQALKEQELAYAIAERQAENDIRVRAAAKARDVANNELERAQQARREFAAAVSVSEIDGLRLAMERAALEAEQAAFEREIDRLKAEAEQEALTTRILGVDEAKLQLVQAESDQKRAQLHAAEAEIAVAQARHLVSRRQVKSPIAGHVAELSRHAGEWVEPGETIAHVVRLDRLRGEAFISIDQLSQVRKGMAVTIHVQGGDTRYRFPAEVSFVGREVDPVNQQVRVWFDFDNPELTALPGMQADVTLSVDENDDVATD